MIETKDFYQTLLKNGINFFCGVPDSLLKDFCAYITDNAPADKHIITANEGNAIALAAGHYLASQKPAAVYMQNSGTGNCINPLLSLTDEEVYKIPLLMIIGWRGEPEVKDEPQHIKQGKVTDKILKACSIDYEILPQDNKKALEVLDKACKYIEKTQKPFALIVKKGSFKAYKLKNTKNNGYKLSREDAVQLVAQTVDKNALIVSTTGQISRELYEYREAQHQLHNQDFLTVGSMGHASSIALGIALEQPDRNVYCFDGDGAFIMHLGALPVIAKTKAKNFKHIVFNNQAHDSVGAQPTSADTIDFKTLAKSCGYKEVLSAGSKTELIKALKKLNASQGPALLEVKVKCGARKDLGRPKEKPQQNKEIFMEFAKQNLVFDEKNSLENIKMLIKSRNAKNVLVFTGKKSYKKIKSKIEKQLRGIKFKTYSDISPNPKSQEIDKALKKLKKFDFIIAAGGGSVMDFAKLFRFCYDNKITVVKATATESAIKSTPLLAIPTTAGTGAEATKFAVVYIDGKKQSFEHDFIMPDYAILDAALVKDNPKYLKACCAADALCQAIESYWSVNSTAQSKFYAKKAMELCRDYLEKYVNSKSELYAQKMIQAAFLSGRAINISKTTAAHALSYKITTDYNLAHGHAVSLSIAALMKQNEKALNTTDTRGSQYVKNTVKEIKQILNIKNIDKYFEKLFKNIALEQSLKKLGIKDIENITNSVNKDRLKNNPVIIEDLKELFKQ